MQVRHKVEYMLISRQCMLYIHEAELYAYEDEAEIGWFEDHESPAVGGPFDFDRA